MKKHNWGLMYKKYSEKELEDNCNLFNDDDWYRISYYQNLSEKFIEKHSDKLDWKWISRYQELSEEFIKEHLNKIDIDFLMKNNDISEKTKKEIETLKEII
jgi:hypothetical protein